MPGVEGLKVDDADDVPKLRVAVAADCGVVKLNPVGADLGAVDPNWNELDDAAVELLLPAKLGPKENVVFCCPSF